MNNMRSLLTLLFIAPITLAISPITNHEANWSSRAKINQSFSDIAQAELDIDALEDVTIAQGTKTDLMQVLNKLVLTDITKLHILNYPEQSNGAWVSIPVINNTAYFSSIPNSYLNMLDINSDDSVNVDYLGVNKLNAHWGFEFGTTLSLHELLPKSINLYFTKFAQGGTPQSGFIKGTDNYTTMSDMVNETKTTWAEAGDVDILIWGRNETSEMNADDITTLLTDLTTDGIITTDTKVFLLGRNDQWSTYVNDVDTAMIAVADADPNIFYISAKTWTHPNDVHYENYGQITKGRAIGSAIYAALANIEITEGVVAKVIGGDRVVANQLNAGKAGFGNVSVDGKITTGELDASGVTISDGNITANGVISGNIGDTAYAFSKWYFDSGLAVDFDNRVNPVNALDRTENYLISGSHSMVYDVDLKQGVLLGGGIGTENYVTVPDTYAADNMTIAFSYKGDPGRTDQISIFGRNNASIMFTVYLPSTIGRISVRCDDNINDRYFNYYGLSIIDDGNWHRIMITYAALDTKIYVDGVELVDVITQSGTGDPVRANCYMNRVAANQYQGFIGSLGGLLYLNGYTATAADAAADYSRTKNGDLNIRGVR